MAPLIIAAVAAAGTAAVAWWYSTNQNGAPWGGWSQPPSQPGYTNPACPGQPPSNCYQGPPVQGTTPTGQVVSITLAPGTQTLKPSTGSTVVASLPSGATWAASDPALVPTCIGGTQTGATAGGSDPLSISGFAGAGTATLNWDDNTGVPQTTMLDMSAS